jgi:serine/threonine-protein kinase
VSSSAGTLERAIVIENASGERRAGALRSVSIWPSLFEESLYQVDLALTARGPTFYAIAHFAIGRFNGVASERFTSLCENAGAVQIPLSELSIHERARFLENFDRCIHRRRSLPPSRVREMVEQMFGILERAEGNEPRASARDEVHAPTAPTHVVSLSQVKSDVAPPVNSATDSGLRTPEGKLPRVGNYELLSTLGRGGMGEVYFARVVEGPRKGEHVALKRLLPERAKDPEVVARFTFEAQALALVEHPNIVKVFESGVFDGQQCLVMEVVDGRDLRQISQRAKSRHEYLNVDVACALVESLLDALTAVHEASSGEGLPLHLVHGDVAPHNLFVSSKGDVKLGDFGLARQASQRVHDAWERGRPSYLAPETIEGQISVHSDLWSVAVIAYELLTNVCPFEAESLDALARAIRDDQEQGVRSHRPSLSFGLEAVLHKALEKKPKDRYQSAAEFAQALEPHFERAEGTPEHVANAVAALFPKK